MEKTRRETQLSRLDQCILALACLWLVMLTALLVEFHQERSRGTPDVRHTVAAVNYRQA